MDISALIVIFVSVGAGAIAKGATGMGMPLIAVPFLASVLGLQHAVAVMVLPILFSNIWQVYRFRTERTDPRLRFLVPMSIACMAGVAVGVWFLTSAPSRTLTLTLGVILLAYLVFRLSRPHFVISPEAAKRWSIPAGLGAGILQGATSISAPIGVTFIHAMKFSRDPHVFAVSAMFLALAIAQVPTMAIAGLLRPEWLLQGLFALVPIAMFMPVGQWLADRLSQKAFDTMILVFLGVMGLKMVLGL